jgi:putative heme-binding domain-containing protein
VSGTKEFAQLNSGQDLLLKAFQTGAVSLRRATLELLEVVGLPSDRQASDGLAEAAKTAVNRQADADLRSDSIRLLMLADLSPHIGWLKNLVDAREPEQVQAAAVRALGRTGGDETATFLLGKWREMTPQVRAEAGDVLTGKPGRAKLLLGAIRSGEVPIWTLIFRDKRRLLMHDDPAIRDTARALLAEKPGEREAILKRYQAALDINGEVSRGKQLFDRVCAKCHQLNGVGGKFGPDLATVRNRTPDALLSDIIIPSRSIAQNYEMYVVELAGGGTTEGIIAADTPTSITLRHEDGKEDVIARKEIKGMYASTVSAMPADLDKQIDRQQMADLLKFLKAGR